MAEKIGKVDDVAGNVAAISQQQAASSEEILATSETMVQHADQITADSQVVSKGAGELTASAKELFDHVGKFKIEKGAGQR